MTGSASCKPPTTDAASSRCHAERRRTTASDRPAAAGPAVPTVRVLVADDQQLICEGIASLLGIQPGIDVVGTARDGREAVERAVALEPDVVVMDVRMPGCDGTQATARIRRELPSCRVVMLTTFDDEEYVVRALRAGAAGYLLKDLPAAELASAIRLAHAGIAQFGAQAAGRPASALSRHPVPESGDVTSTIPGQPGPPLTAREVDVQRLVARGATNRVGRCSRQRPVRRLEGLAAFGHLVRVRHCGRRWPGRPSADGWLLVAGCGPQAPSGHAGGPACRRPCRAGDLRP